MIIEEPKSSGMLDKKLKILIIDDDEINNFIATKLISRIEPVADVFTCLNGAEGIDFLANHINEPDELPDVILLDINMPIMNGWEFVEKFSTIDESQRKDIEVYMVSSSIDPEDIEKANKLKEIKEYIIKPIDLNKLIKIFGLE